METPLKLTMSFLQSTLKVRTANAFPYHLLSTGPTQEVLSTGPTQEVLSTGPTQEVLSTGPTQEVLSTGPTQEVLSTGPTQEDPFWHGWKMLTWT